MSDEKTEPEVPHRRRTYRVRRGGSVTVPAPAKREGRTEPAAQPGPAPAEAEPKK